MSGPLTSSRLRSPVLLIFSSIRETGLVVGACFGLRDFPQRHGRVRSCSEGEVDLERHELAILHDCGGIVAE